MRIRLTEERRQKNINLISKRLNSLTPQEKNQATSIAMATLIVEDSCNKAETVEQYYQLVNAHVNRIKEALQREPVVSLRAKAVKVSYKKKPGFFRAEQLHHITEKTIIELMQDPGFRKDPLVKDILSMESYDGEAKRYLDSDTNELKPR